MPLVPILRESENGLSGDFRTEPPKSVLSGNIRVRRVGRSVSIASASEGRASLIEFAATSTSQRPDHWRLLASITSWDRRLVRLIEPDFDGPIEIAEDDVCIPVAIEIADGQRL